MLCESPSFKFALIDVADEAWAVDRPGDEFAPCTKLHERTRRATAADRVDSEFPDIELT